MTLDSKAEAAITLLEQNTGTKSGYRRAHARGLVFRGSFTANPGAKALTIAEHMQGETIPCLIRFSNASGNPCAPDSDSAKAGKVLGCAVRFEMPSGAVASWAGINIPVFPSRTPEEFLAFAVAQKPGPQGKPKLWKILWHILKHLHILAGVKSVKSLKPSASFAAETFFGLHTYFWTDGQGGRKAFRYRWVPRLQAPPLNPEEAGTKPEQYLLDEIRARAERDPVGWDLVAQFATDADPLLDASVRWPEERPRLVLGQLSLTGIHEDQKAVESLVFDPTAVVPGLEASEDPILRFRSRAYSVSFARRSQESRSEPAPPDMRQ